MASIIRSIKNGFLLGSPADETAYQKYCIEHNLCRIVVKLDTHQTDIHRVDVYCPHSAEQFTQEQRGFLEVLAEKHSAQLQVWNCYAGYVLSSSIRAKMLAKDLALELKTIRDVETDNDV